MPGTDDAAEALERSRRETRSAFANRAHMYAHILDTLVDELGEERAAELMAEGIRRRGREVGEKYRPAAAAGDLAEVGRIFCADSPAGGALFHPGVESLEDGVLVLSMTSCPLLDAWRDAGLPEERCDLLCRIAAAVDEGTFEGAGLELEFLDRLGRPGASACLLRLTLPADAG